MHIMILGLGKSGTTALLYKIAAGLPGSKAFSGGRPGKHSGNYENAVYKHTYEARKGKDFDLYRRHLGTTPYDCKIWLARDPRDAAVSRMLYRWHRGLAGSKHQFRAHLDLVLEKERNPASIPFHEICRYAVHGDWPASVQQIVEEERLRYEQMHEFVAGLDEDWFLFTFEKMVAQNYDSLNRYLGFEIAADTEVPESTGKAKVVRKKASGDWRQWFTPEDIDLFKPVYKPYMELIGYDTSDWSLATEPTIDPAYSSDYMQKLPARVARDTVRRFTNRARRLFGAGDDPGSAEDSRHNGTSTR